MISAKRIVYLITLAMLFGLAVVQLRTEHMKSVYEMVRMTNRQKELQQEIWHYQVQISRRIESPHQIVRQVEELELDIHPPGEDSGDADAGINRP